MGGHKTVKRWFDRYDGTVASLQQKYRSGRPPILNKQQVNKLITKVVRSHNRLSSTIDYIKITNSIRQETNINVSLRTIRRCGQNSGIKYKKTIKRTYTEMSDISCDAIAKLRRKLQRVSINEVIFIDETHVKIDEVPRKTLVAPAIVGNRVLPPIIFTPEDRRTRNVKGINSDLFIEFIENVLCPSITELDPCPMYLVSDKSNIHNASKIEQAFRNVGYTGLTEVLILPTQAAKRVSPLHNTLFHEWKERIRKHSLLAEETLSTTMINEWYNTNEENIKHHYDHCAITGPRRDHKTVTKEKKIV
ncbi:unnamed protein product [Rotaria sp. Silwood2]|nr:unnamed protein product [Rotaria sp. Silwood2]CAF4683357.1 unnamed protein product [Rotaria sp. Silwood2]